MSPPLADPDLLDRQMQTLGRFGASGAVMVSAQGATHYAGAVGFADRARGVPMTVETISDVASISKQFTAAAVVLLAARGELGLHDPLERHLSRVPAEKRGIDLHQLLTQSAGLGPDHFASDFEEYAPEEAERRILAVPLATEPGTAYRYSNDGYTLLARIVERVAGQPFTAFMHRELLDPAGLRATGWYNDPALAGRAAAHGYAGGVDRGDPLCYPGPTWALLGNGGVLSTVGDLQRWATALRDGTVLEPAWAGRLFEPALNHYAYGWRVWRDDRGRDVIEHGGASELGHSALLRIYPASDVTVAIVFNADLQGHPMVSVLGDRIARIAWGDAELTPLPAYSPRGAPPAPGRYALDGGGEAELWREGEELWAGGVDAAGVDALAGTAVAAAVEARREDALAAVQALRDGRSVQGWHSPRVSPATAETVRGAWARLVGDAPVQSIAWAGGEESRVLREIESDLLRPRVFSERILAPEERLVTTYVRVVLERGAGCMRLVWADDGLAGCDLVAADVRRPGAMRVVPDGERLCGLDLRTLRAIELRAGEGTLALAPGWDGALPCP